MELSLSLEKLNFDKLLQLWQASDNTCCQAVRACPLACFVPVSTSLPCSASRLQLPNLAINTALCPPGITLLPQPACTAGGGQARRPADDSVH